MGWREAVDRDDIRLRLTAVEADIGARGVAASSVCGSSAGGVAGAGSDPDMPEDV
ncbi:hypothetical protein [Aureimonas sp. Leaf454]|uniref:hypothetical protein n=1 Tax=Aureimonas sp. Leaf454 TaxID=1736381 RepID=UPI0012E3D760|nr:hypothetical protein [Aureimonas sp. Leaf454]